MRMSQVSLNTAVKNAGHYIYILLWTHASVFCLPFYALLATYSFFRCLWLLSRPRTPHCSWNPKAYYHVGTSSSMKLILSQLHPIHTFIPHFFKVCFTNLTIIASFPVSLCYASLSHLWREFFHKTL
jgi:hypothetical protein